MGASVCWPMERMIPRGNKKPGRGAISLFLPGIPSRSDAVPGIFAGRCVHRANPYFEAGYTTAEFLRTTSHPFHLHHSADS